MPIKKILGSALLISWVLPVSKNVGHGDSTPYERRFLFQLNFILQMG